MTDSERAEFELMREAYEKAFGPPPVGAAWASVGYAIKTHEASEAMAYAERFKGFIAGWVARRAPRVQETVDPRAQKLKGLQVMIGATSGVPEAIDLARSRFIEAYGRSPLHDDLAYACMLIDAYGRAPAAPVAQDPCVICGSDEPYTGTCGSNDPRALCKKPAPQPPEVAPVQMPDPVAKIFFDRKGCEVTELPAWENLRPYGTHDLVSVQKVHQLLAAHGIKGA